MVSGISFRAKSSCMDKASNIEQPQAYTRQNPGNTYQTTATETAKPKKKHTALKVIGGLVAAAAVIAGGLAAGKHFKGFDKIIEKVGADATGWKSYISKGAEYANKGGDAIINGVKTAYTVSKDWVTGFFKKAEEA